MLDGTPWRDVRAVRARMFGAVYDRACMITDESLHSNLTFCKRNNAKIILLIIFVFSLLYYYFSCTKE